MFQAVTSNPQTENSHIFEDLDADIRWQTKDTL